MKPTTLAALLDHHMPYARQLAQEHGLGPLQSRGVEGKPSDPARTAVVTFRFQYGTITHDSAAGTDYEVRRSNR